MAENDDEDDSLFSGDLITGSLETDIEPVSFPEDIEEIREAVQRQNELLERQSDRQTRQLILMVVLMGFHAFTLLGVYYSATAKAAVAGAVFILGLAVIAYIWYWLPG